MNGNQVSHIYKLNNLSVRQSSLSLFSDNEDWFIYCLSYLDIRSLSKLDIAITNHGERSFWLRSLSAVDSGVLDKWVNSKESLLWILNRKICIKKLILSHCNEMFASRFIDYLVSPSFLRQNSLHDLQLISLKDVECTADMDDDVFFEALGCRKLEMFTAFVYSSIQDYSTTHLVYPSLQEISFPGFKITDNNLFGLSQKCPELIKIDLSYCQEVTNIGIRHLARGCSLLKSIDISGLNITDVGISSLSEFCPFLEDVLLFDCKKITDKSLASLALNCKNLSKLSICECSAITDTGLVNLACSELKSLKMNFCVGITNLGVIAIAKQCLKLESIDFTACDGVSDMGVVALANGCSQLSYLNFCGCIGLTGIGVFK